MENKMKTLIKTLITSMFIMTVASIPVMAADKEYTEDGEQVIPVTASIASSYSVTVPATLALTDDGTGKFVGRCSIGAKGQLPSNECVYIKPKEGTKIQLHGGGDTVTAELGQNKFTWGANPAAQLNLTKDTYTNHEFDVTADLSGKSGRFRGEVTYMFGKSFLVSEADDYDSSHDLSKTSYTGAEVLDIIKNYAAKKSLSQQSERKKNQCLSSARYSCINKAALEQQDKTMNQNRRRQQASGSKFNKKENAQKRMINTEKDIETLEMVYDALDNNRVKVFYQPQFDTKTCKLVSAEALCRIENEYHELILPGSFIPVLEKQESPDAIRNFDWYIFTLVCRFLNRLRREGIKPIPISVNLSRRHLLSNPTELYLANTARQLSIPNKYLEVEITESAAEEDPLELQTLIYKIRTQGFRVAIDDFGSGHSNFQFLINNQVDTIKLDRSFISKRCADPKEQAVVASLITLAKKLGMTVVAEGVEDPEQWHFLREHGCDLIQGFLLSEPLTEDEFINCYYNGMGDI